MKFFYYALTLLTIFASGKEIDEFEVSNYLADNFILIKVTPKIKTQNVVLEEAGNTIQYGSEILIRNEVEVNELVYISPLYALNICSKLDPSIECLKIKNIWSLAEQGKGLFSYTDPFVQMEEHLLLLKYYSIGGQLIYKLEKRFPYGSEEKVFGVIEERKIIDAKLIANFSEKTGF